MELKVLEETKTRLVLEVKGWGHIITNALKSELWNDKNLKAAGYNIAHPLEGIPILVIETNTNSNPRKALNEAIKRLKKNNAQFFKEFKKIKRSKKKKGKN